MAHALHRTANGQGLHVSQGSISPSLGQEATRPPTVAAGARRHLPDRNVTASTIEDAFTDFILHCNPAVPLDTDTAALREAFRTPPKSGGKSFSSFTLFQLIRQLETKELKTWAELALKLGVEPPDQEKGQSSQKIQQYAVRLKRWMHSMHVDAFFDYLLEIQHPYWTQIPTDPTPVCEAGRDGVAAEDDMALRALLPQIRPKRGRRKPEEDDLNKSPSQRPRLDSPAGGDDFSQVRTTDGLDPWSAHPDGRNAFFFPDQSRLGAPPVPPHWPQGDMSQTPLTAYPQSAITPSTRAGFWEHEPRSAITPSKPKSLGRRHGAKVVSSAWRSGSGSSGKTRGRPPINRPPSSTPVSEGPFSAFPTDTLTIGQPHLARNSAFLSSSPPRPTLVTSTGISTSHPPSVQTLATAPPNPINVGDPPSSVPGPNFSTPSAPTNVSPAASNSAPPKRGPARPAKPSRLSLQVPQRPSGSVRLATPPPVVMVNGEEASSGRSGANVSTEVASKLGPAPTPVQAPAPAAGPLSPPPQQLTAEEVSFNFHHMGMLEANSTESTQPFAAQQSTSSTNANNSQPHPLLTLGTDDRTNMAELECFFMDEVLQAHWLDSQRNPVPAGSLDEIKAMVDTTIENLVKAAETKEMFLINLAALAGARILLTKSRLTITRVAEYDDRTEYTCQWELGYGGLRGTFEMRESVPLARWKKPAGGTNGQQDVSAEGPEDDVWAKRYRELMDVVRKKDQQLGDLRMKLMGNLKDLRDIP